MTEHLTKAQDSVLFAIKDLQQALRDAGPVSGIILLKLIEQAVTLERGIDALRCALEETKHANHNRG